LAEAIAAKKTINTKKNIEGNLASMVDNTIFLTFFVRYYLFFLKSQTSRQCYVNLATATIA
jgi:hypothetical protein